jgi:FtsH-binding integral membrane protein
MGIALSVSAVVAFVVGNSPFLIRLFFSNVLIALLVQLAPLFFVFNFSKTLFTSSVAEAKNKLYIFAGLMGLSLSTVFLVYTKQSIVETFLTTAATFGGMSLYGYTTKKDLSSLTSFLYMGVMGLFIASIVNMFVRSSSMSYTMSCIGVVLFTLYTAYDVQKLRNMHNYISLSGDVREKMAVFGALELYVDFINLFMSLLRILNSRDRE